MDLDNHIKTAESNDWLRTVRAALPSGLCQDVFDIWCQIGDVYDEYIAWCAENEIDFDHKEAIVKGSQAHINHMAEFFGVGRKAIVEARQHIQINSFRYMSLDARKNIKLEEALAKVEA